MQVTEKIKDYLEGVKKLGIGGHIRPDGDCVGAGLGLYAYIRKNFPEIEADIYLQPIAEKFKFLK